MPRFGKLTQHDWLTLAVMAGLAYFVFLRPQGGPGGAGVISPSRRVQQMVPMAPGMDPSAQIPDAVDFVPDIPPDSTINDPYAPSELGSPVVGPSAPSASYGPDWYGL